MEVSRIFSVILRFPIWIRFKYWDSHSKSSSKSAILIAILNDIRRGGRLATGNTKKYAKQQQNVLHSLSTAIDERHHSPSSFSLRSWGQTEATASPAGRAGGEISSA